METRNTDNAPQGHTPERWQTDQWMTGPTTPSIGGVTCEEQCEYAEYWRLKDGGKDPGPYPKIRHTPITIGDKCVAITVGENHKELAAFIIESACSHTRLQSENRALRSALEEVLREAKTALDCTNDFLWRDVYCDAAVGPDSAPEPADAVSA